MTKVIDSLAHRGPDDAGVWIDPEAGVALGHRRLSIVDLSPAGRQPMISESGRYIIVFNGEIYNFQQLRAELESVPRSDRLHFSGHSDTEVMLACFEHWGLEKSLQRFNGMYAFALWDRRQRWLHLVRDRLGEKPLYYAQIGNAFLFGSELKALRAYPVVFPEVDRDVLALFLRHSYIPSPYSIYKGVWKLPPAGILTVRVNGQVSEPRITSYWSARQVAEQGGCTSLAVSGREAVEQLDALLADAVRMRMVADVPLGAFLSGGIDSSTVVALMQSHASEPVKTFTIGFHETGYNEAHHAKAVAQHLGTDHTELYLTPREAMAIIPRLPALYDEPFADSSQVPTFLVSALARRHVTVSLSGDGGDELFGGYPRYVWGERILNGTGWMPRTVRRRTSELLMSVPPRAWDLLRHLRHPLGHARTWNNSLADRVQKLARILSADSPEAIYLQLVSHWKDHSVVLGASERGTPLTDSSAWPRISGSAQRMMFLDLVSYLPDDILVKVDRASMAVGLESRAPLLDHRLVEFVWQLPLSMKIDRGQGKRILRDVLHRYVPRALVERPKTGFGVPLHDWLREPLRCWTEELLDESRLRREGYFNPIPVRQAWREHLSRRHNRLHLLWTVLMFQSWLEAQPTQQVSCSTQAVLPARTR
jgi:asparagine synthase (glutamine-hydrolysing)